MKEDEEQRLRSLERRIRVLTVAGGLAVFALVLGGWKLQPDLPDTLRLRQLTIVDERGVERVWLGAPVPDPIVRGERRERSGAVSGLVLLGANGNEKGGFVTADSSGEVFIGLDSDEGQEVLFLVNPGGGGHLSFYDRNENSARIGVLDGPTIRLRRRGEVVFEAPQ